MFSGIQLKTARLSRHISQEQLGQLLRVNKMTISNWEKEKNRPNQKHFEELVSIFQLPAEYFYQENRLLLPYSQLSASNKEKVISYSESLLEQQEKMIALPAKQKTLYPYRVYERLSAGTGYSYFGDGNFDVVFYDEQLDYDFASWVFGDSMEPTYLNGEVVLIKQDSFDYDGAIYAVEWEGQTYIKKVYREENGLRLVSLNKKYPDKFAAFDENPRIIGKIIANFMPLDV
ncbi:TPA: helix-turn-helix transcriptional regulator [Streptococcus equi subsp. zooepidemicus]|uniref:Phage transcriptional repressor n=1 Tax=Streptococcus equi subsp. ruminatorum CECT 5772 TaxID=1051981 RepID=A0A922T3M3_9STRE|nr:helix-turn-helix transcriptional regulator [Streptococcus equi]HEL0245965.1 helix-turn-helix transcriptional regulator [Streptococcus equi subsp. zooepidemicus]HEL1011102.1 helix-turn-helix transcriptional regulator [Streptococcus equi subsp. ruminatorum]KED03913.1 Phage transcriptional repressor [Streptococcus equi subsp. ruminatorum CECT 5772]HEL1013070.1 helix-turn-helix transcriptional regulator [Streptococcus equi subsp. ruminatorum]HEL1023002.1 helix-turn-helix transcriptional regulat